MELSSYVTEAKDLLWVFQVLTWTVHTAGDKYNEKQIRSEHQGRSPERMNPSALIRCWERCGKKHYGPVEACVSASAATCDTNQPSTSSMHESTKNGHSSITLLRVRGEKTDELLRLKLQAVLHIHTTSPRCLGSFTLLKASSFKNTMPCTCKFVVLMHFSTVSDFVKNF